MRPDEGCRNIDPALFAKQQTDINLTRAVLVALFKMSPKMHTLWLVEIQCPCPATRTMLSLVMGPTNVMDCSVLLQHTCVQYSCTAPLTSSTLASFLSFTKRSARWKGFSPLGAVPAGDPGHVIATKRITLNAPGTSAH
jgi:hypothetical protein